MSNLGERLNELMLDKNVDSKKLASDLSVAPQSVNNWKANRTDLGLSYLIRLCRYFQCSLDYLVGRSEHDTKPNKYEIGNFGEQVRKVMNAKGITSYQLRKDTRYDGGYFYVWDKGSDPKLSTLIELANYFKCSPDELVGME